MSDKPRFKAERRVVVNAPTMPLECRIAHRWGSAVDVLIGDGHGFGVPYICERCASRKLEYPRVGGLAKGVCYTVLEPEMAWLLALAPGRTLVIK